MSEAVAANPTIRDVLDLLAQLRASAAEFQEHIDIYFAGVTDWQNVKARFATFESRFAALEVRLATAHPEPEWQAEELDYMLNELHEIRQDFTEMRAEFLRALQESPQRVM